MVVFCGKNYTLHLVGCPRTEEQLQDIPCPRAELGTHVTAKFVQAFGILGSGIGAGVAKYKVRSTQQVYSLKLCLKVYCRK